MQYTHKHSRSHTNSSKREWMNERTIYNTRTERKSELACERKRIQKKDTRTNGELVISEWVQSERYSSILTIQVCFYVHRAQSFWSTLHTEWPKINGPEFCTHLIFLICSQFHYCCCCFCYFFCNTSSFPIHSPRLHFVPSCRLLFFSRLFSFAFIFIEDRAHFRVLLLLQFWVVYLFIVLMPFKQFSIYLYGSHVVFFFIWKYVSVCVCVYVHLLCFRLNDGKKNTFFCMIAFYAMLCIVIQENQTD